MPNSGASLPAYRGHVDAIEPALSGWVVEIARPEVPVAFAVGIDGAPGVPVVADRPRPDVAAAGLGPVRCGFAAALPARSLDGAEHAIAIILPDGRDLALPGLPRRRALGPVKPDLVPAAAAGADAVLELLRRTEAEAGFDPRLVTPERAAAFNAIGSPLQGSLLYARTANRLVGYARLDRDPADPRRGVIGLTVLEAFRRKGVGETLLRTLLAGAAQDPTLRQVWLSVRPDNAPAIRLYEKLGFRPDPNHPLGDWANPGEIRMVWVPAKEARPIGG